MVPFEKRKEDLSLLGNIFPKTHPLFQVVRSRVDEIEMKFIESNGNTHVINANIADNGVKTVWFSESEEIEDVLSHLTNNNNGTSGIVAQVHQMLSMLCELFSISKPEELEVLAHMSQKNQTDSDEKMDCSTKEETTSFDEDVSDSSENYYSDDDDNESSETMETSDIEEKAQSTKRIWPLYSNEGIPEEGKEWMNIIRSNCASSDKHRLHRRLADELRELYQSEEYKTGMYSFEMCLGTSESRVWLVNLYKGHGNRPLTEIIPNMRDLYGNEFLVIELVFDEEYPFKQMKVNINTPKTDDHKNGCIGFELDEWLPTISTKDILKHVADKIVDAASILQLESERFRQERAEQQERDEMNARERRIRSLLRRRERQIRGTGYQLPQFTSDPRSIQYYKN